MNSLVGQSLVQAKSFLEAKGKQVVVIKNFVHQNLDNPTLVVTNAKESGNVVTLVVGEFFLGGRNV